MRAPPLPADAEPPAGQQKHKNGVAGKGKKGTPDKTARSMNGSDFAKAIGINKPANVRDKIKRWQVEVEVEEEGEAGLAAANEAAAEAGAQVEAVEKAEEGVEVEVEVEVEAGVEQNPKSESEPQSQPERLSEAAENFRLPLADKPNWKPVHTPHQSLDDNYGRTPTASKPLVAHNPLKPPVSHNPLDDDLLTATAPKKRVISDSHWRQKQPPPKETGRPPPKTIPNAWVRPSKIIKNDKPPAKEAKEIKEARLAPPSTPPPNPLLPLVSYVGKSTGQTKVLPRQRRPSKPASADSDPRPTSSGSGSAKQGKMEGNTAAAQGLALPPDNDPIEIVKVRRRRRARTSPRTSISPDAATPYADRRANKSDTALAEDETSRSQGQTLSRISAITSPRDDEIRERRRRRRPRSQGDRAAALSPRDVARDQPTPSRRRSRRSYPRTDQESEVEAAATLQQPLSAPKPSRRRSRRSWPRTSDDDVAMTPVEPIVSETRPPKMFGTRLEAWLSGTSDPLAEAASCRPGSMGILSGLDRQPDEVRLSAAASTDVQKGPVPHPRRRSSGGSSRRRRRQRSRELQQETETLDNATPSLVSTALSSVMTESSAPETESQLSLTPTPTPSLKRRGARRSQHSPTKSRSMSSPLREATSVDDPRNNVDASLPSSSADASTLDFDDDAPLRPRPLSIQRGLPARGKKLSTIVSIESSATQTSIASSEMTDSDHVRAVHESSVISGGTASQVGSLLNPETSTIVSRRSTRRRKLASHADLISVLSMSKPTTGTRSIMSARSIRTNRSRLATASVGDIMRELASDEAKYMRELRTIVDGVIPVLLSCVLSKSDSAVAAGLFSRSGTADPNHVTKPIVNMGVCLERLKTLHKRVPQEDPEAFISWAQSAQRVYADYIAAWRLGFQDVVISLAPADDDPFKPAKVVNGPDDGAPWDEGMPRNADGYVVNGDGERVDVAYMLKRPLVRIKYLAKTLRGVNHVKPSERAETISSVFQDLVAAARKRSNDEQARLEDEAAAAIDPTRARDPRSLAPLAGVRIDPKRCVRARDHFDLHLYHSSGQEISCRVEILLRDNIPGTGVGGDILICEVDSTGRWLLLPPIQLSLCSARNGDLQGEIVVMIRGHQANASEWNEVMSLRTDDEQAGFDWVQMLGLTPIPRQISEVQKPTGVVTVASQAESSHTSSSLLSATTESTMPQKSRSPSPHEIEIPIGEQHTEVSKVWRYDALERREQPRISSPTTPPSEDYSHVTMGYDESDIPRPDSRMMDKDPELAGLEKDLGRTPRSLNEAVQMATAQSTTSLKRARATKRLPKDAGSPVSSQPSRQITLEDPVDMSMQTSVNTEKLAKPRRNSTKRRPCSLPADSPAGSHASKGYSVWMPSSDVDVSDASDDDDDENTVEADDMSPPGSPSSPQRPQAHRRVSSVPSLELPSIPRQRKISTTSTSIMGPREEPRKLQSLPATVSSSVEQKAHQEDLHTMHENVATEPPPTPPHRSPSPATPVTLKGSNTPLFTPSLPGWKGKRRSSSPLKHEYEPSTCTEESTSSSSTESDEEVLADEGEISEEDQDTLTSDSSEDELNEDVPMPLMPIGYLGQRRFPVRQLSSSRQPKQPIVADIPDQMAPSPQISPPASIYTLPNGTITPSQSASNTPYRAVPEDPSKASRTVASIFAWSDAGRWDSLHPEECSIVITPGKMEVFEISAHHSESSLADTDDISHNERHAPLIVAELTPLVPLRKSTAIDISIRSPPIGESRIKTGNNIMLRSRSPAECAQLYAMINQSRINNPTYLALQNARGPYGQASWADAMDRQNAARTNGGSLSGRLGGALGRRSSYRKTSTRAASISAATESSVGTMNTALKSALGRFSFSKRGMFSIRESTLGSRSSGSFDSGSPPGSGASTPTGDPGRALGAPAGITNTKCRLYERESMKKWRDMGSARLTIMLPSTHRSGHSSPTNTRQRAPGTRDHTQERRIVVTAKSKGTVLLDVMLSETCFERVARSGIAVSVWEDHIDNEGQVGTVGDTGGVLGARARVFMVQMKSERECAYCFSLVGKLRY